MKLQELDSKELRKETYKLRRELREDIKAVKELSKTAPFIPQYAVDLYKNVAKTMREKAIKYMTDSEVRNIYRDLKYISSLKSSTPEGAFDTAVKYEKNIGSFVKGLSEDERKEFFKFYDKAYGLLTRQTAELFKYEIFDTMKVIYESKSLTPEEFAEILEEKYKNIEMKITQEGGYINDAQREYQINILFTDFLTSI